MAGRVWIPLGGVAEKRQERIKQERAEARRKVSVANKRIRRLENKGLEQNPAYEWLVDKRGGKHFSVKGLTHNELMREMAQMDRFLNMKTSTVRGMNSVLKEMANNTGITYKNLAELQANSKTFFDLASKVEQYLDNVEDRWGAINYKQTWEAINKYLQDQRQNLKDIEGSVESVVENVIKTLDDMMEQDARTTPLKDVNGRNTGDWIILK